VKPPLKNEKKQQ